MAYPEGYRKGMRVMELAGRHGSRCYPRRHAWRLPRCLGGAARSGRRDRALAGRAGAARRSHRLLHHRRGWIRRRDRDRRGRPCALQEHAIYSVISPEGCAAILWRDAGGGAEGCGGVQAGRAALARAGRDRRHRPRAGGRGADGSTRRRACSAEAFELALSEVEGRLPTSSGASGGRNSAAWGSTHERTGGNFVLPQHKERESTLSTGLSPMHTEPQTA